MFDGTADISIPAGTASATDATTTAKGVIQLAGDLRGTAASPTVNTVGGVSSSTIGTINTSVTGATSSSTINTIVKRDASGNFSAGTITASLTGNATSATTAGTLSTTLPISRGGTGLTATGTAGQVLASTGSGTLTWTTPISTTIATDITVNGITIGAGAGTTTSTNNTVFGSSSLAKNTTGANNVGFGPSALNNNTTGNNNASIGASSLFSNISGSSNVAIGKSALQYSLGSNNTGLGAYADIISNNNISNATAIGYAAKISASNTIQLGADGSDVSPISGGGSSSPSTPITNVKTTGTLTLGGAVVGGVAGASVTYPNVEGRVGQVLTSTGTGTLTWTGGHYIGESFGGGIVFYVYDNGTHGLIAAIVDQSTSVAWSLTSVVTNAVKNGTFGGTSNTDRIIMNQGAGAYAAQICANYLGGNFADWYLPSNYELDLLYQQKAFFTGTAAFTANVYWSSTESSQTTASGRNLGTNVATTPLKTVTNYVRAIRAF